MRKIQRRLTFANVVSCIALFVALGGAAYAAGKPGKNSVGTKQIKNSAVTAAKIKNGTITGTKINLSSLGAVPNASNAANAANSSALGGQPASAFASASVVRSATVEENGTVVASKSDGISQANVTHPAAGFYCVSGLSPAPKTAVATAGFGARGNIEVFVETNPGSTGECGSKQVGLATYEGGVSANAAFALITH